MKSINPKESIIINRFKSQTKIHTFNSKGAPDDLPLFTFALNKDPEISFTA